MLSLVDGPGGRGGRLGLGLLDLLKFVDMSMTVLNSRCGDYGRGGPRIELIDVYDSIGSNVHIGLALSIAVLVFMPMYSRDFPSFQESIGTSEESVFILHR